MERKNILCNFKITLGLIKPLSFIIYSCIKVIVGSDLSGYAKPHPQYIFILRCCSKYQIEPQNREFQETSF